MQKSLLSITGIVVLGVLVLLVNAVSDRLLSRFYVDLTEENLYSLSQGSENLVKSIAAPITLKFYFSKTDGSKYPAIKLYGTRVLDLLKEYERKSNGMLTLETYDPRPDTEEEEWAQKYGLSALNLPDGGSLFFGLVGVGPTGEEEVIPLFDFTRQEFLEYDVSKLIYSLNRTEKPIIGVISSLDVKGTARPPHPMMGQQPNESEPWIIIGQLEKFAQVIQLDKELDSVSGNVDLLMVIHPKNLSEKTRYAIDQYIVKGGRAIIAVDPYSATDTPAADPNNPLASMTADRSSDLPELFKAWGVEFTGKGVIGDINLATRVSTGGGTPPIPFPVWVTLGQQGEELVNRKDVITALLDNIMLAWPGGFTFSTVEGLTVEPLLLTTEQAALYNENDIRFNAENPEELLKKYRRGGKSYALAAKITGKFKSSFPNRPGAEGEANESSAEGHLAEGTAPGAVLLIADVDFMAEPYAAATQNMFGAQIVSLRNDNIILVANAVENLTGSDDLIALRSRGKFVRPFTKVQQIEANAQEQWKEEETVLQAKLNAANQRLTQLQAGTGGANAGDAGFNAAMLEEIKKFRAERLEAQRRLREVRRKLREDKERLGSRLFVLNTFLVPAVLVLLSIAMYQRRAKRVASRGQAAAEQ